MKYLIIIFSTLIIILLGFGLGKLIHSFFTYSNTNVVLQKIEEADQFEWHRQQAIKEKTKKTELRKRIAEYEEFCGKGNVKFISNSGNNFYSFECFDYTKVPDENLIK